MSHDPARTQSLLESQGLAGNVELIEGNVLQTLPAFLDRYQEHSFAIVNIDVDLYEGTKVAIEQLFPRVVCNGIVILDDYEGFPGAKRAVDLLIFSRSSADTPVRFDFGPHAANDSQPSDLCGETLIRFCQQEAPRLRASEDATTACF